MKSSNKWISGIDADTSLRKAARVSLRTRLAAVWYYLPLAAEQADDNVEYVHQLRVSTRRALAALRLYGRLCRKRDVRWFRTKLKQIRRAAGDARVLVTACFSGWMPLVLAREKGVRYRKCKAPLGPFRFSVPDPFFGNPCGQPELLPVTKH
jgi:hypothetical protein